MRWSQEASEAVSKVPFFVRKRVKKRVEDEALRSGAHEVNLAHVKACQKRFLEGMEDEVKGFQVETCFGPSGCPNRAVTCDDLAGRVEERIARRDLRGFLKDRVKGPLKLHHEFRVSISDCPNACSRPQIADLGLIGARRPRVSEEACSRCNACAEACREGAISFPEDSPVVDFGRCLSCGQCVGVCPTGTLQEDVRGYRVLAGGKLGRHPRLGEELPGIHDVEELMRIVERCLDHYQAHCREGERFGEILERTGGVKQKCHP
jgi:dissimilatory sulfite reductase (desulfoviridin) alpha/beta subunit